MKLHKSYEPVPFQWVIKFLILILCLLISSCTSRFEKGTAKNPISIFLIPGQDPKVLEDNGNEVAEYLKSKTGLSFEVKVPSSYIAVVEALGSNKADVAIMNTFGYILAHDKYQSEARLMGIHFGQKFYQGQILTRKGHLKNINEINGKKFAYVDPASTSGFLMAIDLFNKKKIKPKEYVFAGKHDSVIAMIYQNQVDAGATFHTPIQDGKPQDARKLVLSQYPDVFEKIVILDLTSPIPNDPFVFRKDLSSEHKNIIEKALIDYLETPQGKDVFMKLYNMNGIMKVNDQHYDEIRKTLKDLGKTAQDFIKN